MNFHLVMSKELGKTDEVLCDELITSVADPGFGQGGPRIFFRDFANIAKQSRASKVNNIIFQYKRIWEF